MSVRGVGIARAVSYQYQMKRVTVQNIEKMNRDVCRADCQESPVAADVGYSSWRAIESAALSVLPSPVQV